MTRLNHRIVSCDVYLGLFRPGVVIEERVDSLPWTVPPACSDRRKG